MTDKQIIIDGVPVQDCCYFDYENDGYEDSCYIHQNECSAQNCYYKQLKRKEQECERLKDKLNCCFCNPYVELNNIEKQRKCIEVTECFRRQLDQLKAENENFKSLIYWLHYGAIDAERVISEYYENRNTPYEENFWKRIRALQPCKYESKYKTTLTEVKEIAVACLPCDHNCEGMQEILDKISECEATNER